MSSTPFHPQRLLQLINQSLPGDDPVVNTASDAIAIFVHSCLLSVGFRLLGLHENDRLDEPLDADNPGPLPNSWNVSPNLFSFRYAHSQSALQYLVRTTALGPKTVIMGLGVGDDKTTTFDIVTSEYTTRTFPSALSPSLYISEQRMSDLATLVKINIIQRLIPSLLKDGYEEEVTHNPRQVPQQQQQPPRPDQEDPLRIPRPYQDPFSPYGNVPPIPAGGERPPGFDDEYEIFNRPTGYMPPGQNPLSIGADDLNPPGLGPNPPMRGPFFGEGGGYGGFGGGGESGSGGMHPGPDHPMFGGQRAGPNPRAPPGARYDPVQPGDYPPTGGLRGPRGPGPGPGGPGGPGGTPFNPYGGFGGGDFI